MIGIPNEWKRCMGSQKDRERTVAAGSMQPPIFVFPKKKAEIAI